MKQKNRHKPKPTLTLTFYDTGEEYKTHIKADGISVCQAICAIENALNQLKHDHRQGIINTNMEH